MSRPVFFKPVQIWRVCWTQSARRRCQYCPKVEVVLHTQYFLTCATDTATRKTHRGPARVPRRMSKVVARVARSHSLTACEIALLPPPTMRVPSTSLSLSVGVRSMDVPGTPSVYQKCNEADARAFTRRSHSNFDFFRLIPHPCVCARPSYQGEEILVLLSTLPREGLIHGYA